MRLRWKILIVLLTISLLPIVLLRITGQRSMQNLGNDLAARTRNVLIARAGTELEIIVEEHARILQRERELIEAILHNQALELEKHLANSHPSKSKAIRPVDEQIRESTEAFQVFENRFRITGSGKFRPLPVSYGRLTILQGANQSAVEGGTETMLQEMVPVFRRLAERQMDLIFWQLTAFEDGTQSIYPAVSHVPMRYDGRRTEWYRQALGQNNAVWTLPTFDPFTRRIAFTVSKPIRSASGIVGGVTAIVVPVSILLQEDDHIRKISDDVQALLVRPDIDPNTGKSRIRVIAHTHKVETRHHHWQTRPADEWFVVEDAAQNEKIRSDLSHTGSGTIETRYQGADSLVAYGSMDEYGTALMLILRKEDVVAEALAMGNYVAERISNQIRLTGIVLMVVVIIVGGCALVLSRSIVRNIQKLVFASRRIAAGDFSTRVDIASRDEMGELGQTFNRMVPALEERVKMKHSLDLAMQVQQSLLPGKVPKIAGLDIAAYSRYCDETGGDFYDFLDYCCWDEPAVGIAVGDVSGHGIPAALLMASVRGFLRSRAMQARNVSDMIQDVNRLIARDTEATHQFVTLFYMECDAKDQRIRWIRGGHEPALFYDPQIDRCEALHGDGLALGVDPSYRYLENTKSDLRPGQIVVIGTDGIWETQNESGEMFGKHRLKKLIQTHHGGSAEAISRAIMDGVDTFRGDSKQADDMTLVVIKFVESTNTVKDRGDG